MNQFRVGQKVRVKMVKKAPNRWDSAGEMKACCGQVMTIKRVMESIAVGDDRDYYLENCFLSLRGDRYDWTWRGIDFEPATTNIWTGGKR